MVWRTMEKRHSDREWQGETIVGLWVQSSENNNVKKTGPHIRGEGEEEDMDLRYGVPTTT